MGFSLLAAGEPLKKARLLGGSPGLLVRGAPPFKAARQKPAAILGFSPGPPLAAVGARFRAAGRLFGFESGLCSSPDRGGRMLTWVC